MSVVQIDLSNYRDRVGTRVPEGTYTVLVEDADLDKSSNGNPMITLWLVVQNEEYAGATVVDRLTITEKALFRVVGFMSAIGMPTPKKKFSIDVKRFIGKTLDIEVGDGEPYNGRVKSEVRGYMRPTGAGKKPQADLDDLEDLGGTFASTPRPEDLEDAVAAQAAATETPTLAKDVTIKATADEVDMFSDDGEINLDDIEL